MKLLPLGIQSFSEIRKKENNYIYADKTQYIEMFRKTGKKYVFLSRPRRFGKSLFIDTIRHLYEGNKELFKGLYIYDKWNFENETRPVIRIIFGNGFINDVEKLKEHLYSIIKNNCIYNGLDIEEIKEKSPELQFQELIQKLHKKTGKQVVILVDEYDKPILDLIKNLDKANEVKDELKGFYSVIKGADEHIKFVMLTGVTKFSKVSVFSGLNNLDDITIDKKYNGICGYTYDEIIKNFGPEGYLKGLDLEKMKMWYNGYSFGDISEKIYNPFGLLNFFSKGNEFQNYWFSSATPTFLIELIKTGKYNFINTDLEYIKVGREILDSFDVNKISLTTLLFQSGYLTLKNIKNLGGEILYTLGVPNEEVRKSLNDYLLKDYLGFNDSNFRLDKLERIYETLGSGDIDGYIEIIKEILAGIPYSNYTNNEIYKYEGFYSSVVYSFMAITGIEFIAEDFTNKGRIDFTMKLDDKIFIVEFKVEKTGAKALEQIKEKNYSEKYLIEKKEIYLIGISFDSDDKNIYESEWEKIS